MRALVSLDDVQLRRIDTAIAHFESRPPAEQRKLICLLTALQSEKAELLACTSRRVGTPPGAQ